MPDINGNPKSPQASLPTDEASLLEVVKQSFQMPHEDVVALMDSVKRGESIGDFYGITPETLNAYENVAVALYNQHQYEKSEEIFVLLTTLSQGKNASYWRGLAACRQGQLDYQGAIKQYLNALSVDPKDALSSVYLAECLLTVGQIDNARVLLQELDERSGAANAQDAPHIKRARAMLASIDQYETHRASRRPQTSSSASPLHPSPQDQSDNAPGTLPEGAYEPDDIVPEPESNDPEVQALLSQPGMREKLAELQTMLEDNRITLREIADFSPEQMDAGYAVCCALLEQQNYPKALEICGWMIHLDAQDPRFYQLAGLCAFNMTLFCLAEHLFNMDTIWRSGGPDPATLIYKAEAHFRQDEIDEGLKVLSEGMELAGTRLEYQQVVKRGRALQQVYSAARQETST